MKLISWNVNGLRACLGKGFMDYFPAADADFFCLQETKLQQGQVELELPGYHQYWNYAEKKGYSGTAIFAKEEALSVHYGLGIPELDTEGRLITLEYPNCWVVTCYTPNAQEGLKRLDHRMAWEDAFRAYLTELDREKPVMVSGDLNVARSDIDLKNPGPNRGKAGFSNQEREKMETLLEAGFTDSFRYLYPDVTGAYSWWSYRFNARKNNAGWRIDYWLVSQRLRERIEKAEIHSEIFGLTTPGAAGDQYHRKLSENSAGNDFVTFHKILTSLIQICQDCVFSERKKLLYRIKAKRCGIMMHNRQS